MEGALLAVDGRARRLSLEETAAYEGPGFLWIHLEGKDQADLAFLKSQKDMPDVVTGALAATETRPRCDRIDDAAILNLRGPGDLDPDDSDRLVSIRFWVTQCKVVSLSRRKLGAIDDVVRLMEGGRIHDSGDLVAAFAQGISKQLDPQVSALGDALDECESHLETGNLYELRRTIARIRSEAIGFRRFVAPDRDALRTLPSFEFEWLADDDRLHIVEAADRFARMTEELEAVRERAALLHEQITDMRAEVIDRRSLLIAIVALIFLPLTYITGLFGMNVKDVPYAQVDQAFWYVTGFTLLIAIVIAVYFTLKNWLRH
jgi:zinc transporter